MPQTVTYYARPYLSKGSQQTVAFFAQDQWTIRHLTLNVGARLDYLNGWIPELHMAAGTFVPERNFAKIDNALNWKDINPRLGVAYDLFGNGRTAVKAFLGRYVGFQNNGGLLTAQSLVNSVVNSATRSWSDTNGDYIPQDNELGALSPSTFGTVVQNTFYADHVTHGWQTRDYSWQGSVSVQHELRPGLAVNFDYFRTWYGNFLVTDNLNVTPADYDQYCIAAPTDSRLPSDISGSHICGLYDIKAAKFGSVNNLVEKASKYGTQLEIFNGVDVTMNARFGNGGQISGGLATGRTLTDNCDMQIDSPQNRFCRNQTTWSAGTQIKFSGLYRLPWDLRVSGTYQNIAAIATTAGFVASNALIKQSLGRDLAACRAGVTCTQTVTVDLIAPNSFYKEGRNTQVNVRLTRTFTFNRTRVEPQVDLFNVFNSNQVLVITTRYAATNNAWNNVAGTGVLAPRVVRLGVQVNF